MTYTVFSGVGTKSILLGQGELEVRRLSWGGVLGEEQCVHQLGVGRSSVNFL